MGKAVGKVVAGILVDMAVVDIVAAGKVAVDKVVAHILGIDMVDVGIVVAGKNCTGVAV